MQRVATFQSSGKGTCPTEKMAHHAASNSNENKPECKELLIDITQEMEPARWPDCCIYKVPKKLRDVNEKAYNPKLISIGPLHQGREELKDMEKQKLRYFKEFCNRTEISQEKLAIVITDYDLEKIRHCYAADTFKLEGKEFIRMILLDAIFIIELFSRYAKQSKHALHDLVASAVPSVRDKPKDADDYMFNDKWLSYHLRLDLLLLENQLPFFILEKLWKHSSSNHYSSNNDTSFLKLAFAYFYELHPEHEKKPSRKKKHKLRCTNSEKEVKDVNRHFTDLINYTGQSGEKVKHFTDMIRYFFHLPEPKELNFTDKLRKFFCLCPKDESEDERSIKHSATEQLDEAHVCEKFSDKLGKFFCFCSEEESEDGGSIKHLYSATQLDEAGVKFKRVKHRPLLDIKFKKNMCLNYCPFLNCSWLLNCLPCFTCLEIMQPFLEVPTFEINDETECVFRNLMAFEQCHSPPDPYICNYILLLDRFINSAKDVEFLVDEKVVVNFLGSNKRVATLVNNLCLEIVEPEKSRYRDLSKRLNKHYGNFWNKHMAKLSRIYFGDFWRGAATVVGLSLLVFTLWNYHRLLIKGHKF